LIAAAVSVGYGLFAFANLPVSLSIDVLNDADSVYSPGSVQKWWTF
jgi:hypothetical protein